MREQQDGRSFCLYLSTREMNDLMTELCQRWPIARSPVRLAGGGTGASAGTRTA